MLHGHQCNLFSGPEGCFIYMPRAIVPAFWARLQLTLIRKTSTLVYNVYITVFVEHVSIIHFSSKLELNMLVHIMLWFPFRKRFLLSFILDYEIYLEKNQNRSQCSIAWYLTSYSVARNTDFLANENIYTWKMDSANKPSRIVIELLAVNISQFTILTYTCSPSEGDLFNNHFRYYHQSVTRNLQLQFSLLE